MKNYLITFKYTEEIEAENETEARDKFWENTIYDTQSDTGTFIERNLKIKEIN